MPAATRLSGSATCSPSMTGASATTGTGAATVATSEAGGTTVGTAPFGASRLAFAASGGQSQPARSSRRATDRVAGIFARFTQSARPNAPARARPARLPGRPARPALLAQGVRRPPGARHGRLAPPLAAALAAREGLRYACGMLQTGDKAPEFTLPRPQARARLPRRLQGKTVVLAFFPAAFTGVCRRRMCSFRDALAALNDLNATVLGVSVDAPFSNAAFAERNDLNFPLLSDYKREATRAYGIAHDDFAGLPGYTAAKRSVFVIDPTGT